MLRKDFGMTPYKVQLVQELKPLDGPTRNCAMMSILPKKIIISDETHLRLGGYVYKQNCCVWGSENPHMVLQKPMHPLRVTACSGLWSRGIIAPYFFENKDGATMTVNGDTYRTMIIDFFVPALHGIAVNDVWFQHDGESIYCIKRLMTTEIVMSISRQEIAI